MTPSPATSPGFFWIIADRSDRTHLESLGVEILTDTLEERPGPITTYTAYIPGPALQRLGSHWNRYYWGREPSGSEASQ